MNISLLINSIPSLKKRFFTPINPKNKSYGKFLYLVQESGSVDYVGGLYDSSNIGLSGYKTVFTVDVYVFAKKNKIVWCKSKEKISRNITLEGLQTKLK